MGKGRIEAFSDGVLAVAITLLVLDLHVEATKGDPLWQQLRTEWPSFAAFVISFFVIGVIWVNHHALFTLLERIDRLMLFYNLLLLFWVCTIPFTTATLANDIESGSQADIRLAVGLYGISNEGMAISFFLILRHMLWRPLVSSPVSRSDRRSTLLRFSVGAAVYPVITVVGLISAPAMFVLYLATIIYYVIDQAPILADPAAATEPAGAERVVTADIADIADIADVADGTGYAAEDY